MPEWSLGAAKQLLDLKYLMVIDTPKGTTFTPDIHNFDDLGHMSQVPQSHMNQIPLGDMVQQVRIGKQWFQPDGVCS